jgi:biopolymer transport protein ExbD
VGKDKLARVRGSFGGFARVLANAATRTRPECACYFEERETMPLKTHHDDVPTLNLTSMIDVVFLLIIFFMVGTQFAQIERQYDIDLPTVSAAQPLTSLPDEIVINVRRNGDIVIKTQTVSLQELRGRLREARRNYADQAVVIRGEGAGEYQHIVNVLAVCHEEDINSISLAHRVHREVE